MKKLCSVFLAFAMIIALSACGGTADTHEGEAKTPSASKAQKGRNYQEAVDDFTSNGFTNVKTEKLEDLISGWLTKDGEVETVSVDGDENYSADSWYPNSVEVVITYHTFPEKNEETATSDATASSEKELEILTVENNEDLSKLLESSDFEIISAFAQKYAGQTIEFDANIADMANYKSYKTRYDMLIYVGDYSETTAIGPSFKFEDVNVSDLKLTGDNIPDSISSGLNIRITAKIVEFNSNTGLFFLDPISTKIR